MELEHYIMTQLTERYRCFVLCGSGLTGKTKIMKKAVNIIGGKYIDVLESFLRERLDIPIESFTPMLFFSHFNMEEEKIIAFDNIDFLFSLWTETQQREFIRKLDIKSNGSCIAVILHNYKLLEETSLMKKNTKGQSRIINIAEFS